jgi:glyoxylate carboligase
LNNVTEQYRVADFIADFIADLGVKHVFLLPGGGAMYLMDGVGKHPGIKTVACLHEQAAAISAEAYARINENIGVAMVTTGPGATNAITAVAGAWIESVPLMIISGQVKRADMLRGAPLRQKGVQEVDIVGMVKSITKLAVTVERPEDIRCGSTFRLTCKVHRLIRPACNRGRAHPLKKKSSCFPQRSQRSSNCSPRRSGPCCWPGMACAFPARQHSSANWPSGWASRW